MRLSRVVTAAATAAAAIGLVLASPAIGAQAQTCPPGGTQYPPSSCEAQVSKSSVAPGGSLTVSGSGYDPSSNVALELNSAPRSLGSATTNSSGSFSKVVTIPSDTPAGQHTIRATGTSNGAPYELRTIITVSGSGLPRTGTYIAGLVVLGLVLLAVGGMAVVGSRRRRTTTV